MLSGLSPRRAVLLVGDVLAPGQGWTRFPEGFWGEFDHARIEVRELLEAGDQVLGSVTLRGRGKRSGVETSWTFWQLWTVRNGKVVRGQGFRTRHEALEAAGLSE